jgi:hypothetical protein
LEYYITKGQKTQVGLKFNGPHQLLAYADDVNLRQDNIEDTNKTENLNLSKISQSKWSDSIKSKCDSGGI